MSKLSDGSINLIVMDPPYNIGKSKEWDKFKDDEYIDFMGRVFRESQRVLKDNGQIYWFHNDIITITRLMNYLETETGLIFSSFLIFPKYTFRCQRWKVGSENNSLRSWFNICEFSLLYINGKSAHTEWDKTGWDRVRLDVNNFSTLRQYAYEMLAYIGGGVAYTRKQIERDLGHRKAEHFFYCEPRKKEGL